MKTHEIVGFKRANLGKSEAQELRSQGYVPSVLYGSGQQVHFYAPAMLFRELLFTPDIYNVTLNIEGTLFNAILQEKQLHPQECLLKMPALFLLYFPERWNVL